VTDGRVISVITPVHPEKAQFLDEAWESLAAQDLPQDWDWQWVVQEDGTAAELAGRMPDDTRVTYAAGRAGGPAVARTIALAARMAT
jgi:glycosyltransferase involved in cell wall biosynthesis